MPRRKFYVLFNGPFQDLYYAWEKISDVIQITEKPYYKGFNNLENAKAALAEYRQKENRRRTPKSGRGSRIDRPGLGNTFQIDTPEEFERKRAMGESRDNIK